MMLLMTRRAALYCRISMDREGAGLGVARQEQDCRALADRLGWTVAQVYTDNDVSAYSGKPRPAWNRLLTDVRAGTINAVTVWHVDRLTRSPRELEDVIDLADRNGLALATVTGEIDLANPTGRMVARMLGAAARHESEHKAERVRRAIRQGAEAGKSHVSGRYRPFGYTRGNKAVLEPEAAVIRECAARVLVGESLASICRDLNRRGLHQTSGNPWRVGGLGRVLISARISGRREFIPGDSYTESRPRLGEIVCTDAAWPAIITPADSDRLRALIGTRRAHHQSKGRRYLLSGILCCGHCGAFMSCTMRSFGHGKGKAPRYLCQKVPGEPGCGRMSIMQGHTDDYIRDVVLKALDSPEMAQRLRRREAREPDLYARIRADEDLLEQLAADLGAGDMSRAEWKAARAPIQARLNAARERLAQSTQTTALDAFVGTYEEMAARWEHGNVSQRRAVLTAVLEKVVVNPAQVWNRFDPDRLGPVWRA